jgi:surfeit locus 1 family protein
MMTKSLTNFIKIFIYPFIEYLILMLMFFGLMKLGHWQLFRAHQKEAILQQYQMMQNKKPQVWTIKNKAPKSYQAILLNGCLLKTMFYLDNQFNQHQIGFNVLVPLEMPDGTLIMLDLGWVPAGNDRNNLPMPDIPSQTNWQGRVYYPPQAPIQLGQFVDHQQGQIYVIESLNFKELEKILGAHLQNWVLRLSPSSDTKMKRDWPVVTVMPQRHYAYALQWFVMAAVVGIIFLWRVYKNAKKHFKKIH